jgi:hypothetical protein
MDITMPDCTVANDNSIEQNNIINTIFNVNERDLCVKTVSGKEYTFRVSKNQLVDTFFRYIKPIRDITGMHWYAISQYHIAHNRVIELYVSTMNTYRIFYKDTGVYEEVVGV